jgi:hypothetical protein
MERTSIRCLGILTVSWVTHNRDRYAKWRGNCRSFYDRRSGEDRAWQAISVRNSAAVAAGSGSCRPTLGGGDFSPSGLAGLAFAAIPLPDQCRNRPEDMMSTRIQLLSAWCGPAAAVVVLLGWLLAGVLPMPLGSDSPVADVVAFYATDTPRVVAGIVLSGIGFGLVFPLVAVIAVTMVRMEGRTPILTFLQLITGAATGIMLLIPMILMAICGFRPDRNPEITVTLNDISWLMLITPIAPFMLQNIAIGLAILNDRQHILPRWAGYLNFWIALSFVPSALPYFFHSGPFAWRGIFVFWLALTTYCIYLVVMGLLTRRAVLDAAPDREDLAAAAA